MTRVPLVLFSLALLAVTLACDSASRTVEGLPTAAPQEELPENSDRVALIDSGFAWDGENVHYAIIAQNVEEDLSQERVRFQVDIFDTDDKPIASDSGTIAIIWPGETVAESSTIPAAREPGRMVVNFWPELSINVEAGRGFEAVEGEYEASAMGGRALAVINNPFDEDLLDLRVTAVLYDADGNVLLGGSDFLHLLPAGGEAIATVPILGAVETPPDRVMVYAMFSPLTLERIR